MCINSKMASNSCEAADLLEQSRVMYLSYLFTGNLDEIEEAVGCAQRVLEMVPSDAPVVPIIQYNLARPLVRRYLHTRQKEDVSKAIDLLREASERLPDHNPVRQMCFKYSHFSQRVRDAELGGSIEQGDLHVRTSDSKTNIETLAHELLSESDEIYQYYEVKTEEFPLQLDLHSGFSLQHLNFLIQFHQQALKNLNIAPVHPQVSYVLFVAGAILCRRASTQGAPERDIDVAIDYFSSALKLPMSNRLLGYNLCFASHALLKRFGASRQREDLDQAVNYAKLATEKIQSQDIAFAFCMCTLGTAMCSRYEDTGGSNMIDLDAAIDAFLCAVDSEKFHHPTQDLPTVLMDLVWTLQLRHQINGQFEDIRQAIKIAQRALDSWEPGNPRRLNCLLRLSDMELLMGVKAQDKSYIDRGLQRIGDTWDSFLLKPVTPNADTAFRLLQTVGRRLFEIQKWDEAKKVMRILQTLPTFESRPQLGYLSNLCEGLYWKYARMREEEDLDEAIETGRRLVEVAAKSKVNQDATIIGHIVFTDCLRRRYDITRSKEVLEEALEVALKGFRMSATIPQLCLKAGEAAIEILSEMGEWDHAYKISKEFVSLFVSLNSRALKWTDKQYWLQLYSGGGPLYASIALQAKRPVFEAIDLLETCRGSVLGHVIDNRTDLDDLKRVAPNEAEHLSILRDVINADIDMSQSMNARIKAVSERGEAEAGIRTCLARIRKLEGFERYLLGPTESEVKSAASEGPIVIVNVTSIRSDAIIITKDEFFLLPLTELKHEDVVRYHQASRGKISNMPLGKSSKMYRDLLRWLWNNCVKLILEKLEEIFPGSAKFHVWWIGTGIASFLPFHAAGIYERKPRPRESALFRIISSYTLTLKILIHGRQKLKKNTHARQLDVPSSPLKPKLLIVTMPSTPGDLADLEGVQEEAEKIVSVVQGHFSPVLSIQPSARETMEAMQRCEIVHFACHGGSVHGDPSMSHLLLQATDPGVVDELRVRDVAALNLPAGNSKLAFLSACSTAEGEFTGTGNEGIHLASAFHVAGYLHAVGNLWPADDAVSVQIVESFYKNLVDPEAGEFGHGYYVARALNLALLDVVKTKARDTLAWAPFVHFGI